MSEVPTWCPDPRQLHRILGFGSLQVLDSRLNLESRAWSGAVDGADPAAVLPRYEQGIAANAQYVIDQVLADFKS